MSLVQNGSLPEVLFEVSWEVCNKVGGIHTVLASKAQENLSRFGNNYIVIGPDIWREEKDNPEFVEDLELFPGWRESAKRAGIPVRIGRWTIEGNPVAIIVDFTPLFPQKDQIFSAAWEAWKLDSLTGQWDYVEAALFGYAAGQVIESFVDYYRYGRTVAHFHEWMTGMGVLYLDQYAKHIGTAFTTHATVLGRSIAGNGMPLYQNLNQYKADEMAANLGVRAKHSLEKAAALVSHGFATVSNITGKECTQFLGRTPDVITPNGFDPSLVPTEDKLAETRLQSREKLIALASAISGNSYPTLPVLIGTSGRYEFKNKGIDVFIQTLGALNKDLDKSKQIIAFILVPANHYGPRKSVKSRLEGQSDPVKGSPYLSHNLHDSGDDRVIRMLADVGILNKQDDPVQVFFVPSYLNGNDGLLNMTYYQVLAGLDLTLFPSSYEPWGYTPLESLAFAVPTMTTNLAGFGMWIEELYPELMSKGVWVLDRLNHSESELIDNLKKTVTNVLSKFEIAETEIRQEALAVSKIALWKDLYAYYEQLYKIVLSQSGIGELPEREPLTPADRVTTAQKRKTNDPVWKNLVVESVLPEELKGLEMLAKNLWWTWNIEAEELFESIDPKLWERLEHNPVKLLRLVPLSRMQELMGGGDFYEHYQRVIEEFNHYMQKAPDLARPKIAYLSMEYGFHASLKIYSGGLGILAGDYLKEASDQNYRLTGIGLLYRHGYFRQVLTMNGEQTADNVREEFTALPLYPVQDEEGNNKVVHIAFPGRVISAMIWRVPVGRINLYLLDTDIDENQSQDRALTSNLYGGDEETRLKQEMLLGVGGVRMLEIIDNHPDVYHCNEGHAAFIGFERIRKLMDVRKFTFNESREIVRSSTLFTTHTPVPAGHDAFSEDMMRTYMGHYPGRLNISWNEFMDMGRQTPHEPWKFSMSNLAANLSQEINAVSKLHGAVTRDMLAGLWEGYFPNELHVGHVTNGVHYETWTAKAWQQLYKKTFGEGFIDHQSESDFWSKIIELPDQQVWEVKQAQRRKLITYLKHRLKNNSIKRHEPPAHILEVLSTLDDQALTIGFARRFATYKRAHLLFKDLDRLAEVVNNPDRPVQFLFAGKAHPRDKAGQELIKYIVDISRKPEFRGKIIFLENYDMTLARNLVQGVDVWLNTPTRPLEASGTSGMKAAMNGAMNFSVLDGWWCEGYREDAGWALPEERIYSDQGFQDELDAASLYTILEEEIVPMFYDRNESGIPVKWVQHVKNTIAWVAPQFTTKRMIDDYNDRFYSVLHARIQAIRDQNYHLARELSRWKKKIAQAWDQISVVSSNLPGDSSNRLQLGQIYQANVELDINGLLPDDIGVELVITEELTPGKIECVYHKEFTRTTVKDSIISYKIQDVPTLPGAFKYGIRVFPKHPKLPHRQDFSYMRWI